MNISAKIEGLDEFAAKAKKMPDKVVKALANSIKEGAFQLEKSSKNALAFGETRAWDTGRLWRDTIVREITPLRATIAPFVYYAIYVHEGTSKMRPRPFLEKGTEQAQPIIQKIFEQNLKKALEV